MPETKGGTFSCTGYRLINLTFDADTFKIVAIKLPFYPYAELLKLLSDHVEHFPF